MTEHPIADAIEQTPPPPPGFVVHTEDETLYYPGCDRYRVDSDGDLALWAADDEPGSPSAVFMHAWSYVRIERADQAGISLDEIIETVRAQKAANASFMGVARRVSREVSQR